MDTGMMIAIGTQTVAYAISLFKMWSDIQLKLKELDIRVKNAEADDASIKATLQRVEKFMHESNQRLEHILTEVRIELRDKMDRP